MAGSFMMNGSALPTSNGVPIPPQFNGIIHPNPAYGGGGSGDAQGLGRRLLNAILAGGNFLGDIGQFAGGVSQLAQGPLAQQFLQGAFQNIGNRAGGAGGGRGGIGGGGGGAATGTGVPFGTQAGNYGPLTGAILKHTPQTVLMNTSSPLHQVAKDFYLGPQRPAFNQVH